jgi:chromosome segregation ATPase
MSATATVVELAEQHRAALADKRADLLALDAELDELTQLEREALADWIRLHPSKNPDATSQAVKLRRQIAAAVAKREGLVSAIEAQQQLLEDLEAEASEVRQAQELAEQQAAIVMAEAALSERWSTFVKLAETLREAWPAVVDAMVEIDQLAQGETPTMPMPADFGKAVSIALTEPGEEPYATLPRMVGPRRIALVSSPGTTASMQKDSRGGGHKLSDLSNW